jgi:cytidine deaminase
MRPDLTELIVRARAVAIERKLREYTMAGEVGCALRTAAGNIYVGVSIDCPCGIGFCAEHSAIAAMVTAGESAIRAIAAVAADGKLLAPCGRCREFMQQVDATNLQAEVIIGPERVLTLADLLPEPWIPEP